MSPFSIALCDKDNLTIEHVGKAIANEVFNFYVKLWSLPLGYLVTGKGLYYLAIRYGIIWKNWSNHNSTAPETCPKFSFNYEETGLL